MPIYAFVCCSCGHRFEKYRKKFNPTPGMCPECQADNVVQDYAAKGIKAFVRGSDFNAKMNEIEATGKCNDAGFYKRNKETVDSIL